MGKSLQADEYSRFIAFTDLHLSPVALHIGYQGVQGDYPATLLGVIAYQRQALYDAQRQALLLERYKANPRGMPRPPNDAGLDASTTPNSRA